MVPKNEKELSKTELSYTILLALSVASLLLIDKMKDSVSLAFILTVILLVLNSYAYIKCRKVIALKENMKIRLISILSMGAAVWVFIHSLLLFSPMLNYRCFIAVNKLSGTISDQTVYSSGAISFFIANIVLLILVFAEFIPNFRTLKSYYRSIYVTICAVCFYIMLNYLVLFPGILTSAPVVKLVYNNETIMLRPNQFWVLYYDGIAFEGNIETAQKKWYLDGKLVGTENTLKPLQKGKYHAEIETPKGIIKTKSYKHSK